MVARNYRTLAGMIAGITLVASLVIAAQPGDDGPAKKPQTAAPHRLESPMKSFMHGKLMDGQAVLEGLLVRDFDQVRAGATSLRDKYLTAPAGETGDEDDDQVYEHFHIEFMRLSQKLITMADDENLEGATFIYQNLTSTCIACHDHIRDRDSGHRVKHAKSTGRISPTRFSR